MVTRMSFYEAFGMLPCEQQRLERIYDTMNYISQLGRPGLSPVSFNHILPATKHETYQI